MKSTAWLILLFFIPLTQAAETPWENHFHRGDALERDGHYADSAPEFEFALVEAERLGPADWRLPMTLHNLGAVNRELGRYSEAERYYQRAISIWQSNHPKLVRELACSLHNLAILDLLEGRLAQSDPLFRRAYNLRRTALGPYDPATASSQHGLAELLHQRRQFSEAEPLYIQATAVMGKNYGAESLEVADVSHNRALLYRDMHRDSEAQSLLERAAASYRAAAPHHPKLAIVLRNLADLRASQGQTAESARLFAQALQICDETLPADHPETGIILQAYAKLLHRVHRNKEARAMDERANAILALDQRESRSGAVVDASAFLGR
jgi:tetratricopeptide (TPR) repeat protein